MGGAPPVACHRGRPSPGRPSSSSSSSPRSWCWCACSWPPTVTSRGSSWSGPSLRTGPRFRQRPRLRRRRVRRAVPLAHRGRPELPAHGPSSRPDHRQPAAPAADRVPRPRVGAVRRREPHPAALVPRPDQRPVRRRARSDRRDPGARRRALTLARPAAGHRPRLRVLALTGSDGAPRRDLARRRDPGESARRVVGHGGAVVVRRAHQGADGHRDRGVRRLAALGAPAPTDPCRGARRRLGPPGCRLPVMAAGDLQSVWTT